MMKTTFLAILMLISSEVISPELRKDAENGTKFSINLLNVLDSGNANKNLVCSPYGIRNCFALLYPGAAGSSKSEIERTLQFSPYPSAALEVFKESNELLTADKEIKISTANAFWIKDEYPIKKEYLAEVSSYTKEVGPLHDAAQVNDWVSRNTSGQIKNFLKDEELARIKALLVNCIELDAQWESPFEKGATYQGEFKTNVATKNVPTMLGTVAALTFDSPAYLFVQVPYKGKLACSFIMPKNQSFQLTYNQTLMDRLRGDKDLFGDKQLWTNVESITLHVPKFSTRSSYDLIPTMCKLGLNDVFSDLRANFSNINEMLKIGMIKQNANIELTEYGTKASAATAVGLMERALPETVKINRPFYYLIHSTQTGEIIFMGKVSDPTLK